MKLVIAVIALLLVYGQAQADGRGWGGHGFPHRDWGWNRPGGPAWQHHAPDVGGSIVGGMIGSWLWNQWNQPPPPPPPPPEPIPDATQPWTPAWYEYCSQKYKTFDAHTGYYNGLDGNRHFCQ